MNVAIEGTYDFDSNIDYPRHGGLRSGAGCVWRNEGRRVGQPSSCACLGWWKLRNTNTTARRHETTEGRPFRQRKRGSKKRCERGMFRKWTTPRLLHKQRRPLQRVPMRLRLRPLLPTSQILTPRSLTPTHLVSRKPRTNLPFSTDVKPRTKVQRLVQPDDEDTFDPDIGFLCSQASSFVSRGPRCRSAGRMDRRPCGGL